MNQIMQEYYPMFEMYQSLRTQLMAILTDEDLTFTPGGSNPTLGALCREVGEVETSYIRSFKTFQQNFEYRHDNPIELERSVGKLQAWFVELDAELKTVVSGLTDEEIASKRIVRGPDFELPPNIQLTVYNEALLIFYGKATVYLKAMGKALPQQWQTWIA